MGDPQPSRPLLPSIEGGPSTPPADLNNRRKNARVACVGCKQRKLKCSGGIPCNHCVKKGTTCVIDEEGDQRRKQGLKRKVDTLQEKGKLLDRLVSVLQEADKRSAAQILNLIRSHASLDEIKAFMDDIMRQPKLEKTPELVDACSGVERWHESHKRTMLARPDPRHLSDIVLFNVPAAPWTSVTSDDGFVSHLISLWFTWVHPFCNFLDRDLFIRDMQSGNLESRFCSPFLVNAILADACAYSEYPEAYAVSSHLWSRGLHFYKEAKRLLDEATGKVSVAFLQGLGVLYVVTCMVGKDRNGWVYLHQMANGVDELAQKHKLPGRNADEETRRDARAVESMIWGLFNLASMTAVAFQKGSPVKVPHMPRYLSQRDPHRDKWSNYPIKAENTESHTQCLFDAFCDLSLITHDLSWSVLDGKRQTLTTDLVGMIENAYKRLRGWYEGLPSCLETESATPHVLSFHLMYQTIIQTLFGLMRNLPAKEDSDDRSEVESEIEDESEPDWKTRARQRAQQICLEAARESGRLADLNRDLWGSNNVPPVNVHWVTVAMFTLLSELDEKENSDAFVSLCVAAKSNANLWALGKGTLRLVQVTAKQMEVTLPPETDALFIDFETRFWSAEDRKVFNSQYPNYGLTMKRAERDEIELDAFLAKFDDLYVTEVAENESTRELLHSPGSSAAGDEIQGASSVER